MVELLENIHLYNFMSTTNNQNLYAVYSNDGILAEFQENNSNTFSKVNVSQTIAGGESNAITGNFSTILGGYNNQIKSSDFATILAGRNNIINNQLGATIIADGENRNHYADASNGLTIDFRNGIYLKNTNSNLNGPAITASTGVYGHIQAGYFLNDPYNFPGLKIGAYIGGSNSDNIPSAKNYYPAVSTMLTLQANNWIQTDGYPLERTDSISSIILGPSGIKLKGTNATQQLNENPAVAYININSDITLESAKDGNVITLNSDSEINLNGAVYAQSYHSRGIIDYNIEFYSASDFNANAKNAINLISSGANGAGGYIKLNSLSIIDRVQNFSLNTTGLLV